MCLVGDWASFRVGGSLFLEARTEDVDGHRVAGRRLVVYPEHQRQPIGVRTDRRPGEAVAAKREATVFPEGGAERVVVVGVRQGFWRRDGSAADDCERELLAVVRLRAWTVLR